MRYSADHKAAARARIVSAASRAIREQGLEAPSVPHIMRKAGLTHGGFYNHFQDRDALIAEAIAASASETLANVLDVPGGTVDSMLALYLSGAHVANRGEGCVLAALGTDAPHASPLVRGAFAATAREFISHIGGLLRSGAGQPAATGKRALSSRRATKRASTTADVDDDALVVASRMIGAVILARLVDDEKLATRILAAARRT